ncbi:MAG: tRNA 4-thiouridine(8) synthase ThiI [Lachnospiraceae bacterium]|nr:tRNA 4-thiouridine(8) synthase ThiI [Lachnospiraceae bacterium]
MRFKVFLIKYAEIGVKGKNRGSFEDALVKQVRRALRKLHQSFNVYKQPGRIYAEAEEELEAEDVTGALSKVFGIVGICPAVQLAEGEFDDLALSVTDYMEKMYGKDCDKSFKVFARRTKKSYPMTSQEINEALGEKILDAFPNMHVDVHEPQIPVYIEVRDSFINLYTKIMPGPGGMPVGTAGKLMLLLSGGIDSPVAGYMVAKRGCKIDATYFHAPPYTSEWAKKKVIDLARIVAEYSGPIALHIINFAEIQMAIYEKCPHEELTVIMRRYMMRIAQTIAKKNECLGLVTGESIGQVASQTLHSMAVTNAVCEFPVYRPCIGLDKQEIVELSKDIGAFETSILPYEDCCTTFAPDHPVTHPNLERIELSEKNLEDVIDEMVEKALATDEILWVRPE